MKFLCVSCDEPLKLKETSGPDESGSLAVVYFCPKCSQQMAMLTNAHETQLVTSLGIKIGAEGKEGSKCPFASMLQSQAGSAEKGSGSGFKWTEGALARLEKIPEFIRPMAKMGIEKYAMETGHKVINVDILDRAKGTYGIGG